MEVMAVADLVAGDGAVWLGLSRDSSGSRIDTHCMDCIRHAEGADLMAEVFRGCDDNCFHCQYSDCLKSSELVLGVYKIVLPDRVPFTMDVKKTPSIAATVGSVNNKTVKEIISQ